MKNAIIVGGSGMVGGLIVDYCFSTPEISNIRSLVRKKGKKSDPKLKEIVINDFTDYDSLQDEFKDIDIAFFCLGAYTGQVSDEQFKKITVDFAVAFAQALSQHSPQATLCLLSGAGADRTEKSKIFFAKYKGMAENKISTLPLKHFYSFRPGYIYPVTPRKEPNLFYRVSRTLYPLIRLMGKNMSIKSTELANAMLLVGIHGASTENLENRDILARLEELRSSK